MTQKAVAIVQATIFIDNSFCGGFDSGNFKIATKDQFKLEVPYSGGLCSGDFRTTIICPFYLFIYDVGDLYSE